MTAIFNVRRFYETDLYGVIVSGYSGSDIVAQQLGTDKLGVTTSLVSLGLSSLGVMRLSMAMHKELGESPLVSDIMKDPTIRGMAACLGVNRREEGTGTTGIGTYEVREYYPITENQRGLYIDWELHPDTLQMVPTV